MTPSAADPHLSASERTLVLERLEQSHQEFLDAIHGVSEAQWLWKPAPERWSLGECAEHIVLAEALLFQFVRRALASPPNPAWYEETNAKTELLVRVMSDVKDKASAPAPIVPGLGLARGQVRERFENQRLEIAAFARETHVALKAHTAVHPFPIFGTLNAHQWLLYVPLHTMRHGTQIAGIKTAAGYPILSDRSAEPAPQA